MDFICLVLKYESLICAHLFPSIFPIDTNTIFLSEEMEIAVANPNKTWDSVEIYYMLFITEYNYSKFSWIQHFHFSVYL